MYKKTLILFILIILFVTPIFNQSFGQVTKDSTSISKNTVYFELLGNGGLYSLNYDRILFKKNRIKIFGRIGISYLPPLLTRFNNAFIYPLETGFLYGKEFNLDLGICLTPYFLEYKNDIFKIYDFRNGIALKLGYRFQKPNGGYFLKGGIYAMYSKTISKHILPWLGFAIGYTFLKQ